MVPLPDESSKKRGPHDDCKSECFEKDEYVEVLWGVDQYVADVETRRLIENTNDYMTNQVMVDDEYSLVRDHCRLRDELCSSLAAEGKFRIQFC